MTTWHITGVKASISQGRGALTTNVKAVHTERNHRYFLGLGADPFIDMLGITPNSTVEDVAGPRAVVSRARVDDLRALTRSQHRLACLDCGPVDIAHKSGDIGGRAGALLDVVRVLVHVERQYRDGAGDALRMIGGALIEQAVIPRHVAEEDPAGITGHASASAIKSYRQRSTEPKSRAIVSAMMFGSARPSPPRLAK